VLIAIAGLYANLVGPVPQSFLTPFVMIGIGMTIASIMCLIGRVRVVVDEFDSYVATGLGWFQWKQRFDPRQVSDVEITDSQTESNGQVKQAIKITADRTVQFGSVLSQRRLEWLWAVTRELLVPKKDRFHVQHPPGLEWLSKSET
jgi:hypothetical protein